MAGCASGQVVDLTIALTNALSRLNQREALLTQISKIARDHESCECSAALMILEVLDRG